MSLILTLWTLLINVKSNTDTFNGETDRLMDEESLSRLTNDQKKKRNKAGYSAP